MQCCITSRLYILYIIHYTSHPKGYLHFSAMLHHIAIIHTVSIHYFTLFTFHYHHDIHDTYCYFSTFFLLIHSSLYPKGYHPTMLQHQLTLNLLYIHLSITLHSLYIHFSISLHYIHLAIQKVIILYCCNTTSYIIFHFSKMPLYIHFLFHTFITFTHLFPNQKLCIIKTTHIEKLLKWQL